MGPNTTNGSLRLYLPRYDSLVVATPGAALLAASDIRAHGKITQTAEDTLIDSYIATATAEAQDMLGMVFVGATWKLYLPSFPPDREIIIPRYPCSAVAAVTYLDTNGTLTAYTTTLQLVKERRPPVVMLPSTGSWPTGRTPFADVQFTLTMGYGLATAVPDIYKQLVRWLVLRMFGERLGPMPKLDDAITNVYRQHGVREC